jgi:TRAP-type C4-dicarboxylate transport system permease small subunit
VIEAAARVSDRLYAALALLAALLVLAMAAIVTADVVLRNLTRAVVPGADELSEYILYLIAMLTAPWLLRRGRHVRVDLLLAALRPRAAWALEIVGDLAGIAVALTLAWYGVEAMLESRRLGAVTIKNFIFPEWWIFAPLPACMVLVAGEFGFRLLELGRGARGKRDEATSVG